MGGSFTFSNRSLRLTGGLGTEGPVWQVKPQPIEILDGEPDVIHASFASIEMSHEGSAGEVWANDHGLIGTFYFAPAYFNLLQQAALSAADLEVSVVFSARDQKIETLILTLQHKIA